ncbi:PA and RING finger domain protein [Aspergillus lucknowensis]|uniref:RING-type E3 ubiquitin transferase n=1 Tax=Aspergillus lucknowensis TaxID=176173 RepID=A0ABR4LYX2_9EURO
MRPPQLLALAFCLIFFPIFLTFFSVLTTSPRVSTPSSFAGQTTGLHALFSFNIPSSLFPPSAIISLTDENSTFFLARPAAFGPLLPEKGLSGQLWVASGFGERSLGAGGELGCSDIPGWGEGDVHVSKDNQAGIPSSDRKATGATHSQHHADFLPALDTPSGAHTGSIAPATNDGTDDHLHHPLLESIAVDSTTSEKNRDSFQIRQSAHADIQSLQESAEITGRVVLLSRGGCGFLEKVKWAQRRGAVALIVGDDTRGGSLVTMYARGDTSNVTIPSLFTSYTTAHLLSSLVPPQDREELTGTEGTKVSVSGGSEKESTTAASALPSSSPTAVLEATDDSTTTTSKSGLFQKLFLLLGLGRGSRAGNQLDNRRPPSSGNINWIPMGHRDDQEPSRNEIDDYTHSAGSNNAEPHKNPRVNTNSVEGDGFVIGVQDWRDPDLLAPKSSVMAAPTGTAASDNAQQRDEKGAESTSTLKGGSITPGSGEYHAIERSSTSESNTGKMESRNSPGTTSVGDSESRPGWFSRHILGKKADGAESRTAGEKKQRTTRDAPQKQPIKAKEHEGLWVTLTPTSMSTSPFFDTLLVLVASPLLTLSVVYILLLLRSRIRRRRWRAPKSLVERLPVRTYHTIPTSSSSSNSLRSSPSSPGPVSQTSPLLGMQSSTERARSPPQHQQSEPSSFESRREKLGQSTTMSRRKYTGRQVECVVCLEEYVDGQSRVMSLPCGHEFHAECITPWLTTRRRTCPICKGDVVRSLSRSHHAETSDPSEPDAESHRVASSAPVPISVISDEMSDLERHASTDSGPEQHVAATPPGWRNFAALSFSALSGDTIWHQSRHDSDD